jgi:AcrR family transcriptional regulator
MIGIMISTETHQRKQRVDAQRNYETLLGIGAELLAEHGPDMPFEEVARAAGVGKGTLYRHFPTRDHLIAAVLKDRFDRLARDADDLLKTTDAADGVDQWLRNFDRIPSRFRGLSVRVSKGLADDASAVSTACVPMKASFAELLRQAQEVGAIRRDLEPVELLSVVAALPEGVRNEDGSSRYLDVILRGLRP